MKRGWYKNKVTGDVVFCEGMGQHQTTVVMRDRSRALSWVTGDFFAREYEPIKASGFPSLKPKVFKPRYAVCHPWSKGEAFVMEFEPGKFKVVMKDGREILPDGGTCRYFARFFEDGSWPLVSEAEALARLDKPKPPVPAAEQFGPGPWYGGGLKYVSAFDGFNTYVCLDGYRPLGTQTYVGWVSYEVVRHLWDLGMVSKDRPRRVEPAPFHPYQHTTIRSIIGRASTVQDVPKSLGKPKKKVLVEWASQQCSKGYTLELWDAGYELPGRGMFKTGRTVEVQE